MPIWRRGYATDDDQWDPSLDRTEIIRVVVAANGIPEVEGPQIAADIAADFNEHRAALYTNATCVFRQGELVLLCDNDGWDATGLNLLDELSDCLCAYVKSSRGDMDVRIVSITKTSAEGQ